eukprot:g5822.t1
MEMASLPFASPPFEEKNVDKRTMQKNRLPLSSPSTSSSPPSPSQNPVTFSSLHESFVRGSDGLEPRSFQLECVSKCIKKFQAFNLAHDSNFLLQHSTGSGKSLTISLLSLELLRLKCPKRKNHVFRLVLVLTDRINLDQQLGSTVEQFLEHNGRKSDIRRVRSGQDLWRTLESTLTSSSDGPEARLIVSTMQKFSSGVLEACEQRDFNGSRVACRQKNNAKKSPPIRIAIIADEAHRSHGGLTSELIHNVLNVLQNNIGFRRGQPFGSVYFSFTATPSRACLDLFGKTSTSSKGSTPSVLAVKRPFHSLTMRDAIARGYIHNVLQNYETIEVQQNDENGYNASVVLQTKAKYVASHFLEWEKKERKKTGFIAKAMFVVKSRKQVVQFTFLLRSLLKKKEAHHISVYGAFSGEVDMNFDENSFNIEEIEPLLFSHSITEDVLNSSHYSLSSSLDSARLLVVCNKCETGYNDPSLQVMYVNRKLRGAHAVQVLSRINRIAPLKRKTQVVDFVNRANHIRESFLPFFGETISTGELSQVETELHERLDRTLSRISRSIDLTFLTAEQVSKDIVASSQLYEDIEEYVLLCERLAVEKWELPYRFAVHCRSTLRGKYKSEERKNENSLLTKDSLKYLSPCLQLLKTTHKGSIEMNATDSRLFGASRKLPSRRRLSVKEKTQTLAALTLTSFQKSNAKDDNFNTRLHNAISAFKTELVNAIAEETLGTDKILGILRRLHCYPITLSILQETGMGRVIRNMIKSKKRKRFSPEEAIKQDKIMSSAKKILSRWKKEVALEMKKAEKEKGIIKRFQNALLKDTPSSSMEEKSIALKISKRIQILALSQENPASLLRSLLFNLNENKKLRNRVLTGDLAVNKLVTLSSSELAKDVVLEKRKKVAERKQEEFRNAMETLKKASQTIVGMYVCPVCSCNSVYLSKTTHGTIDGQQRVLSVCICAECSHRWRPDDE